MKKNEGDHFKAALADFQYIKMQNQIPPQMLVKLEYLLQKISPESKLIQRSLEAKSEIQLPDLPQYEKNSLDQISMETGIQLFINIINCLSGKDVVLYIRDQKVQMRKDETLSMWSQFYITIDNNQMLILKKPSTQMKKQKAQYKFQLENLRISKNFREYKKRSVFGISYKIKHCYLIGFSQESACARVHELLRSLVKDKVRKLKSKNQQNGESIENSRITYEQRAYRESLQDESFECQKKEKENLNLEYEKDMLEPDVDEKKNQNKDQHHETVMQYIKKEQLLCDEFFKLSRNQNNLREMIHTKYPNIIKYFLVIDTETLPKSLNSQFYAEFIMQAYLRLNQWNLQIDSLSISSKLSDNFYSMKVQTKKYSYLSWPRACNMFAFGLLLSNNVKYLVIRSSDDDSDLSSECVKMDWNQILEIRQSEKKILITVLCEFDFRGYASVEDSQNMGLKLMQDFRKFDKFIEAQALYKNQNFIFSLKEPLDKPKQQKNQNFMKKKKLNQDEDRHLRKLSTQSEFQIPDQMGRSNSMQDPNEEQFQGFQQQHYQKEPKNKKQQQVIFLNHKLKNDSELPCEQLIVAIRNGVFQRYYLHHHFQHNVKQFQGIKHDVETINNYINQGGIFTIRQNGDVVFYDEKIINMQKDIIKMIIKQLSSNIMSGKSIMNMSLPVQIFDKRSILERIAMGFGYVPIYLPEAGDTDDIIRQAELVTLTIMGILSLHLNVTKPFNPILGQTFEAIIGGIPLCLQQISHHPPISAIYMRGQNFILHGCFHSHAQMGLNQVVGKNFCPIFVEFPKTNTNFEVKLGDMEITGIMYGDRVYRGAGKCFIHEKTNNIFVEYSFGKEKKNVYEMPKGEKINPNTIIGGIYTVNEKMGRKFQTCQNKKKFGGLKPDDIVEKHTEIRGHWGLDMYFNNKKVRTMKDPIPYKLEYPKYCLPSDSNFRLDLIYKKLENNKKANEEKQIMENLQRHDRKLRENHGKK